MVDLGDIYLEMIPRFLPKNRGVGTCDFRYVYMILRQAWFHMMYGGFLSIVGYPLVLIHS